VHSKDIETFGVTLKEIAGTIELQDMIKNLAYFVVSQIGIIRHLSQ